MAEKYGSTKEQSDASRVHMTQAGAEVGFEFRYTDDMRMHNTFKTHQLLHWAEQQGRMHDLKMALFVGPLHASAATCLTTAVLADVAAEIGLDRAEALAVLADQRFANEVRDAEQHWINQGIQGVPAVVFNRRHLVSGAQGVENFTSILNQLAAMPKEAPPAP